MKFKNITLLCLEWVFAILTYILILPLYWMFLVFSETELDLFGKIRDARIKLLMNINGPNTKPRRATK